ncbi:MAG: DUF1116 domain-containing protein [Betaproteobacteria bacterium]|nr:DUF1116 domain-containing protein [Betaproteobacteria bacterium]
MTEKSAIDALLAGPARVVNIGLSGFARDLAANGAPVSQFDWTPPAHGRPDLMSALGRLARHGPRIAQANREVLDRVFAAEPVLVEIQPAAALISELAQERLMLHAGPPVEWARMCGPLKGAVCGAIVFEGWAADLDAAETLAAGGGVKFAPNHHYGAVGPMTGITTRSMPVLVVENRAFGNRACCTINEGLGKVMRFGGNDAEVLARLAWLRDEFGPMLGSALRAAGGVPLVPLIARGLTMGDEMHQRNIACSSLLLRALAPALARAPGWRADGLARALEFMGGNDQFFLNVGMAMGKAMLDPAKGVPYSTIVTAMSRNGTDFGIRVGAAGDDWFVAPVEMVQGLYFPGFSATDANPDMGDSSILETVGLGAFAMAASPAVAGFVGAGGFREAVSYTREMREITAAHNPRWTVPALDFSGVPAGIDVRRVVETGIAPAINTGIAHRRAGVGQIGAGVARAPLACFERALEALARLVEAR